MFYKNLANVYQYVFPAAGKVDFLADLFKQHGMILDVGCSDGRVALSLSKLGFDVEAIDLSEDMIRVAKVVSEDNERFRVRLMDMQNVSQHYPAGHFDGVYCIGNTLVHLESENKILDTLKAFKSVIKEKGILMIQIIHYDYVKENQIKMLPIIENEKVRFERFYAHKGEYVKFRTELTIQETGEFYDSETTLLALKKERLEKLLYEAGFRSLEWYGNYNGVPLNSEHLQLIVVAKAF
jgi:2-polyprenyl-3-methyl-5-hydroxy-6-metoxy-1,4-benzoquinol methylase